MHKFFLNSEGYDYKSLTNKFYSHHEVIAQLAVNQLQQSSKDIWMCDLDLYRKGSY